MALPLPKIRYGRPLGSKIQPIGILPQGVAGFRAEARERIGGAMRKCQTAFRHESNKRAVDKNVSLVYKPAFFRR